nr:MAG TPA: N BRO family, N-terminal domain [Caudoviricetes sp.]
MSTATATTALTLATQKPFGTLTCDFWQGNDNEFYMTRNQIGTALEYAKPNDAIQQIHSRNADRLNPLSAYLTLRGADGRDHETFVYTLRGTMEICRFSRQDKADKFMDFVWDVMESLYNGNSVLAAPDQQTAVSNDTFKLMVDTLVKSQETTTTLVRSFIEDQKDSRTAMAAMMNTMSLLANHILEQNQHMLTAKSEPVAESEIEDDPAVDAEFKATPAKDTLPDYKELKPRKNRSEWRTDTYSTIDKIIANQPGKYTERSDVLKLIYNKMNADYGFVIDEERIKYRRRHPYIVGKIWVISMVEENTQWREIFDIILEDVYNDSILHCVKDNPKVKYDKNGLAEFDANSFGDEAPEQEAPAKPKIKWLRSTTANPNNGSRIDTAVKSVADATNDRTAHSAASYHLIYDEMKPNWSALFTAFQEKFGVKANLRRELFVNSDSLTDRFVFAADAVVTKHSKKEES